MTRTAALALTLGLVTVVDMTHRAQFGESLFFRERAIAFGTQHARARFDVAFAGNDLVIQVGGKTRSKLVRKFCGQSPV